MTNSHWITVLFPFVSCSVWLYTHGVIIAKDVVASAILAANNPLRPSLFKPRWETECFSKEHQKKVKLCNFHFSCHYRQERLADCSEATKFAKQSLEKHLLLDLVILMSTGRMACVLEQNTPKHRWKLGPKLDSCATSLVSWAAACAVN